MHDVLEIAATISDGSHILQESKVKKKAVRHVSANAAMISVGSHTIVQSKEPQSKESSVSHICKCRNNIGRFPHTCSI